MKNVSKKQVIELLNKPSILSTGSCVGKFETEGPLSKEFDICFNNDSIGQSTWETAEKELLKSAIDVSLNKNGKTYYDIDIIFAGDLMNQCTSSSYAIRDTKIPLVGLFGACSTMAYSIALAGIFVDGGYINTGAAATVSHFCAAEKQFRYPLEYGAQRSPLSQRTVTGAGAFIIGKNTVDKVYISRVLIGKIEDWKITDTSNMGAAMAPAAASSIGKFLDDTKTLPSEYDLILTGDLGSVGSILLKKILLNDYGYDISKIHNDCGLLIYDLEKQDVHSGGSGCGCSAVVTASYIMRLMNERKLKKVLFAGTGALMSPNISLQGETIPGICHIVEFNI